MAAKPRKTSRERPSSPAQSQTGDLSKFQSDLVTRGEAAEPGPDGKLPRKATHAIIKKPGGAPEFKRDKFKLF
jgi:hypothetical protein